MKKEIILEIIIVILIGAICFILFSPPDRPKDSIKSKQIIDSLQAQIKGYDIISDSLKKNIVQFDSMLKADTGTVPQIIIKYEKETQRIQHLNADSSIKLLSEHLSD